MSIPIPSHPGRTRDRHDPLALVEGLGALQLTGTYSGHSAAFQKVADSLKCVISSRAVGKYATGLLEEGYATKGFHDKAKSCNWGPMAGFVLSDPRFTKRGASLEARQGQRTDIHKALSAGSGEVAVHISEKRRKDLMQAPLSCMRHAWGADDDHYYWANSPDGKLFLFHLSRVSDTVTKNQPMWKVQYALTEGALPANLTSPTQARGLDYLPVTALVDVDCPSHIKGTYLSATTGDYDLFFVFPKRDDHDSRMMDRRMVAGSDRFKINAIGKSTFFSQESSEVGNITPRVMAVMNQVNQAADHPGGSIVHHSDEAGRPFVEELDFPVIAWVPGAPRPYGIGSVADLKLFIAKLKFEYVLMMNPGWFNQLGIQGPGGTSSLRPSASLGGSYEV
jgi:hypothetical protein